jgi:uncharacterized protein DUF3300
MKPRRSRFGFPNQPFYSAVAILCAAALSPGSSVMLAQQTQPPVATSAEEAPKIPNDQLDSLVAPIALYPDPLLSQALVASTYPLEMIQLQQWLAKNKNLKDKALTDAVEKQNWDPSIQAMAALPDAVKQLAENIAWTTDLGNAFLAQQGDVMDAVQRMRAKASEAGNLKSTAQMKVETKVVETKTVIVIEQANPKVVYVPSYNPVIVYGAPIYPYPPIYYPPATGAVLAFGAGIAIGAAWGGGWGYGCGWGTTNTVKVNVNNTYVNNYNKNTYNKNASTLPASGGNSNWQHNPQHRGAAPYSNQATATKYSGANGTAGTAQTARGGSAAGVSTKYGNTAVGQTASGNNYAVHNGNVYTGSGNTSNNAAKSGGGGNAAASRPSGGASTMPASAGGNAASRPSGGASTKPASSGGGRSPSAGGGGAFGGGNGSAARASSSRGGQSMGGGRGGGGGRRR